MVIEAAAALKTAMAEAEPGAEGGPPEGAAAALAGFVSAVSRGWGTSAGLRALGEDLLRRSESLGREAGRPRGGARKRRREGDREEDDDEDVTRPEEPVKAEPRSAARGEGAEEGEDDEVTPLDEGWGGGGAKRARGGGGEA